MAQRPLFLTQQAQYAQVSLLKPAPFCKLFTYLGSTNKFATPHLFSYLTLTTLFSPSFLLTQFLWQICLLSPPVLSDHNESPDIRFSRGTTQLMSWPDGERYSCTLQSPVVSSPLVSHIHSYLFSGTGDALSHLNFSTHRFPRYPPRNSCSLVTLAMFPLVYAAISRNGRIENPSSSIWGHPSQDISHLILHCPATDSLHQSLFINSRLFTTSGPGSGELTGSMVFHHVPIPPKGSNSNKNNNNKRSAGVFKFPQT